MPEFISSVDKGKEGEGRRGEGVPGTLEGGIDLRNIPKHVGLEALEMW